MCTVFVCLCVPTLRTFLSVKTLCTHVELCILNIVCSVIFFLVNNSKESHSGNDVNTSTSFEDLEVEFAKMTDQIKQALLKSNRSVVALIEQLRAISGVKEKNVPIFQEDIFERVTSIDLLWQKLSSFWSLLDYDILLYLIQLIDCEETNRILNDFLSKINPLKLQDKELVLNCSLFERECMIPKLRVKLKTENCDYNTVQRVKETLCKQFDLEKYSVCLKSIKKGCFELIYQVSKYMKTYLLQFKVTGYIVSELAAHKIISLQLDNETELKIPSTVTYLVCT